MVWDSFKTDLAGIITELENNATLQNFCKSLFGRVHTVFKYAKKVDEVNLDKWPFLMVIFKGGDPRYATVGAVEISYELMVFGGFKTDEPEEWVDKQIQFIEEVEQVLFAYAKATDNIHIIPGAVSNDGGFFPTNYVFVQSYKVEITREV